MIFDFIRDWLDLLWIPVAYYAAQGKQKVNAILFVLSCALMLRLQAAMMQSIGFNAGILTFIQWPALYRGMAVYGFFIGIFLFLTFLSKEKDPYIFMAAAISIFILSFCISSVVMVL